MKPTRFVKIARLLSLPLVLMLILGTMGGGTGRVEAGHEDMPPHGMVCTTNPTATFSLTAQEGSISTPDGNIIYMWGLSEGGDPFQHPGPVLCVNEGDTVTVVVNNTLSRDIFDRMVRLGLRPSDALARLPGSSDRNPLRGRVIFDLLEAYKKVHLQKRESYRLDAIAQLELGETKVRYTGTIAGLWREDPRGGTCQAQSEFSRHRLLANAPASKVMTYAYVNPVIAVFLGWAAGRLGLVPPEPVVNLSQVRQFPHRDNCEYNDDGFSCTVPPGHYFMMGDNRDQSADSRYWGFVPDDHIKGRAFLVWMNFGDLKRIGNGID